LTLNINFFKNSSIIFRGPPARRFPVTALGTMTPDLQVRVVELQALCPRALIFLVTISAKQVGKALLRTMLPFFYPESVICIIITLSLVRLQYIPPKAVVALVQTQLECSN